ncbi:MAG: Ig-like domain-containing protein [archaeon]|nr:Ig-like domain-containing protein [archaeon]
MIVSDKSFEIKFDDTVVAIATVPEHATGTISFSLDNETWITKPIPKDTNLVEWDIPDLDAGDYILFVKYSGDGNYYPVYSENPFSVDQLQTIVTVDPVKGKTGEKVKITARVTDERGNPVPEGTVIIGFNGKEYKVNVVNGIATVEVILPKAGTYSATAYYEGINYNSSYTTFTVEVSDIPGPNPDPNPVNPGNMENTGNPLFVLLIALAAIGLESLRCKF